jgi:hypothetical protein
LAMFEPNFSRVKRQNKKPPALSHRGL